MMDRCYNPKATGFDRYGGRGITVCERWHDIKAFVADMESTYFNGASIDRINNNGNYEPSNCRWATATQQNRNQRGNRLLAYNGETKCLKEWAEQFGIHKTTLWNRLNRGHSVHDALHTPVTDKFRRKELQTT